FGMGIERIILVMENQGLFGDIAEKKDIFIANVGENGMAEAVKLVNALRKDGLSAECELCGRGLKAQLRYADKNGYRYTAVIGDDEVASKTLKLKNMQIGESTDIPFEKLADAVKEGR
ncbi:MAG: histidine--tRNA ligase, partial [Clostridia bacterium]|nr:histidine--tRNA ligase [Clostridia bacterium]